MQKLDEKSFEIYSNFKKEIDLLYNMNPEKALKQVKKIDKVEGLPQKAFDGLKASIYVDVGYFVGDPNIVNEGVKIFQTQLNEDKDDFDLSYNLANGLFNLASLFPFKNDPDWFLNTFDLRKKARYLYNRCARYCDNREIKTQAFTNLGNVLIGSGRRLEALDSYINALKQNPQNGIASAGAAKILLFYLNHGFSDSEILKSVVAKYINLAKLSTDTIIKYGGKNSLEKLSNLLKMKIDTEFKFDLSTLKPYEKFIALNRLALSPVIEGIDLTSSKWDSLIIESIIEPHDSEFGVPPIFPMYNILKSDYLAARWLAYIALETKIEDTGFYMDSLDYGNYGIDISLLTIAQSICLNILDKIAIATSEYFNLNGNIKQIDFSNRWYSKRKVGEAIEWHPAIKQEIGKGNFAIIGLSELSEDLKEEGCLELKRSIRNSSTHRFTILHDMMGEYRECKYIEHYRISEFKYELIDTLQVVRSALFYFVEMIGTNEYFKKQKAPRLCHLNVPSHHFVRGEVS